MTAESTVAAGELEATSLVELAVRRLRGEIVSGAFRRASGSSRSS